MNFIEFTTYRTTKKKLFETLRPLKIIDFQEVVNPIIANLRGIPLDKAKVKSKLNSNEVLATLISFNLSTEDYGQKVRLDGPWVLKQDLKRKIPLLDEFDFKNILNPLIEYYREIPYDKAKWVRYININETKYFLEKLGEKIHEEDKVAIELVW